MRKTFALGTLVAVAGFAVGVAVMSFFDGKKDVKTNVKPPHDVVQAFCQKDVAIMNGTYPGDVTWQEVRVNHLGIRFGAPQAWVAGLNVYSFSDPYTWFDFDSVAEGTVSIGHKELGMSVTVWRSDETLADFIAGGSAPGWNFTETDATFLGLPAAIGTREDVVANDGAEDIIWPVSNGILVQKEGRFFLIDTDAIVIGDASPASKADQALVEKIIASLNLTVPADSCEARRS